MFGKDLIENHDISIGKGKEGKKERNKRKCRRLVKALFIFFPQIINPSLTGILYTTNSSLHSIGNLPSNAAHKACDLWDYQKTLIYYWQNVLVALPSLRSFFWLVSHIRLSIITSPFHLFNSTKWMYSYWECRNEKVKQLGRDVIQPEPTSDTEATREDFKNAAVTMKSRYNVHSRNILFENWLFISLQQHIWHIHLA